MPYSKQFDLLKKVGFVEINQYMRLSQLPVVSINKTKGAVCQVRHALSLAYNSVAGLTSIVVAKKIISSKCEEHNRHNNSDILMSLSVVCDEFIKKSNI